MDGASVAKEKFADCGAQCKAQGLQTDPAGNAKLAKGGQGRRTALPG